MVQGAGLLVDHRETRQGWDTRHRHTQRHIFNTQRPDILIPRHMHIHRDTRPDHTCTQGHRDRTHRYAQTSHTCVHTHTRTPTPLSPALLVGNSRRAAADSSLESPAPAAGPCPSVSVLLGHTQDKCLSPRAHTLPPR